MKETDIFVKMDRKGDLFREMRDGTLEPMPVPPITPLADEEIQAAALADPDAQPITPENEGKLRPVPRIKTLRRALGLTQEEFGARYHIPLGTLRDWEQGRTKPDTPARAYLKVIASDPEGVRRALESLRG